MANKFLQSFLTTGLFDIGDSDERLKWLEQSINDVIKFLEDDYSLLPSYTLVAMDPQISDKEPIMIETEKVVTTYWKALRGKYSEMPRNIHRGVILNALHKIGSENPIAARIIYLTGANFFPYAKLNNEKKLIEQLLIELGDSAEKQAVEEWSFIENEPTLKLGALKLANLKFGEVTLASDQLQPKLKVAIEQEPGGHNAQSHGGNSPWGVHFANHASEGIANAFNEALKKFGDSVTPDALETPINKFFSDFKKSLDSNLKVAFTSLTSVERRSKLLWWKETLYSTSLKRSYRGLDKVALPIIMSNDLNNQIPEITPVSVDFLLRDTLFLLNDKKDDLMKFSDFFTSISSKETKELLKQYFSTMNESEGRISLTDFIGLFVNDKITVKEFQNKTGIDSNESISLSDLSVVVLHDLLTSRLITE